MTARLFVNETFYSLQGEGFWTGTPAFFIRLSGCNLRCAFCDTHHTAGTWRAISDLAAEAAAYPARHVVLTGGEPTLQPTEALIAALHEKGKYVAIETNGTHPLPHGLDWVTLSPKDDFEPKAAPLLTVCDELKLVFRSSDTFNPHTHISAKHHFLQPCDVGNAQQNRLILAAAIDYCKAHPLWRLSLQTHKLCEIP